MKDDRSTNMLIWLGMIWGGVQIARIPTPTPTPDAPPMPIIGKLFEEAMAGRDPFEVFTEEYKETYPEWRDIPYVPPTVAGELFTEAMAGRTPIQVIAEEYTVAPDMPGIIGSRFLAAIS